MRRRALIAWTLAVSLPVAALLIVAPPGTWWGHEQDPYDTLIVSQGDLQVRIQAFVERRPRVNIGPTDAMYEVDARKGTDAAWHRLLEDAIHDPAPIPREWIGVKGDTLVFVRLGHRYGVTTDCGVTWTTRSVADIWRDATGEEVARGEAGIWDLEFDEQGAGTAKLRVTGHGEVLVATSDFGRTWKRR